MKIRNGFVSNSSSSSFMIYGKQLDIEEFYKLLENKYPNDCKLKLDKINEQIESDDYSYETLGEAFTEGEIEIEEFLNEYKIDCLFYIKLSDYDSVYLGSNPGEMKDNETAGIWKKNINNKISKFLGKNTTCDWIDVDYRD